LLKRFKTLRVASVRKHISTKLKKRKKKEKKDKKKKKKKLKKNKKKFGSRNKYNGAHFFSRAL
jgi:hypothetical protein